MEETILSASDMLNQVMGRITKDSKQRKKERLRSNIKSLDDILHHFYAGSLITIGGASSNGKTALALNLLYELAVKQKHPSLFFSLEGTADSWTTRLLSLVAGIDTASLWEGNLNEDEWQKLDTGAKLLADAPIYLEAKKVNHIDKLCEVARQMKTAHGMIQLIVAKNRMGALGECYVQYNASTGLMSERAAHVLPPPPPPSESIGALPF